MFEILQVIISVVVIYLIFSVVVSAIVEWISSTFQFRGKMLKRAVIELFRNSDMGKKIYDHPQLESLRQDKKNRLTSYIPASSFAAALIDIVASADAATEVTSKNAYENFTKGLSMLEKGYLKTLLSSISLHATDLASLTTSIEKWFNERMDRVSGWYTKNARVILFGVSVAVTLSFNVDTLHIVHKAKTDAVVRQRMNELGDRLLSDSIIEQPNDTLANTDYFNQLIKSYDLPIGWPIERENPWYYVLLGWSITVLALTAGAPFWFDILKNLVNLRSSGPRPASSQNAVK